MRAASASILATAASLAAVALGACVPPLPGSAVDETPDASVPPPHADAATDGAPNPLAACAGPTLATALITDFADAVGSNPITFGRAPGITGHVFSPPIVTDRGMTLPTVTVSLAAGVNGTTALKVTPPPATSANHTTWYRFGLLFDNAVDVSHYNSVLFRIDGIPASCAMLFSVISTENVTTADSPRGACKQAPCPAAPTWSFSGSGPFCMPLAGTANSPVDQKALIGVSWQIVGGCGDVPMLDDVQLGKS
jgi:hypothetical protein